MRKMMKNILIQPCLLRACARKYIDYADNWVTISPLSAMVAMAHRLIAITRDDNVWREYHTEVFTRDCPGIGLDNVFHKYLAKLYQNNV